MIRGIAVHLYICCLLPLLVYLPVGKIGLLLAAFSALALHEAGHMICAKKFNMRIESLELLPYGCMLHFEGMETLSKKRKVLVLFSGPAVSLLTALFLYGLCSIMPLPLFFIRLMRCSLAIGLVNLLPMEPLDGGGIVALCLPKKLSVLPKALSAICCVALLFFNLQFAISGRLEICLLVIAVWLLCGIFAKQNPLPMRALRAVMEKENRIRQGKAMKTILYTLNDNISLCRCLAYICQKKYVFVHPLGVESLLSFISERKLMEGYLAKPSMLISEMKKIDPHN